MQKPSFFYYGKGHWDSNSIFQRSKHNLELRCFFLCEMSGYLWNSFKYCGTNSAETPEDAVVEKELVRQEWRSDPQDLYGKGYHLYTGNWYTSGKLFNHLQVNGTAACGTEMPNRLNP